ncbi:MAG: class I SAM-dependent methyltransferase [Candidatus Thiothrix sulfatifontis]|nr:MAG: class I SAM-dependent methyltransferase [Candidatus Thiothrix sulfatifontis]
MNDQELNATFKSIIERVRQTAVGVASELATNNTASAVFSINPKNRVPISRHLRMQQVHVYELLAGDDTDFVNKVYHYLLQREVDDSGKYNYLHRLKHKESRYLIIHELQHSAEGQAQRVQVVGLGWIRYFLKIHSRLQALNLGKLSFFHKIPCKIFAKFLYFYEQHYLFKTSAFLLNAFNTQQLNHLLNSTKNSLEQELENNRNITQLLNDKVTPYQQWLLDHNREIEALTQQVQQQASYQQWLLNHNHEIETLTQQAHQQASEHQQLREHITQQLGRTDRLQTEIIAQHQRISLARQDALYQQYHLRHLLADIKGEIHSLTPSDAARHLDEYMDAYYLAFEDANRGTLAEIRQKLAIYIPYVIEFKQQSSTLPVLDLGCGRGEWLALLRDNAIAAYGVDMNGVMVTLGQESGLDVRHADGLTHLQQLPDASLSAVTSFHVIEHLPFATLFNILMEINRVLIPGGLLIFETPNPENVLVGSHTFYHDFTHRNPITPTALTFLLTYHNFQAIQTLRLHPYPEAAKVPGDDPLTARVNGHLCGPQDFALIAHKSAAIGDLE